MRRKEKRKEGGEISTRQVVVLMTYIILFTSQKAKSSLIPFIIKLTKTTNTEFWLLAS